MSWQGVLLKRRVLTALKVIKVLWDCVCDSPAGRDVLHTHTGTLLWGCGHCREGGMAEVCVSGMATIDWSVTPYELTSIIDCNDMKILPNLILVRKEMNETWNISKDISLVWVWFGFFCDHFFSSLPSAAQQSSLRYCNLINFLLFSDETWKTLQFLKTSVFQLLIIIAVICGVTGIHCTRVWS